MTTTQEDVERLCQAAQTVLSHREGKQPYQGWLRDNDRSRTALTELASALASIGVSEPSGEGGGQDRKFAFRNGQFVNRVSGEPIPHDEPIIIFRARDRHAEAVLREYLSMATDEHHREAIRDRMAEFAAYRVAHPSRMKEPGTTHHIVLNRDTPSGGEGETVPSIPAGMVPWEGGPSAPDDWDGGPVLFGNGNLLQPSSAIPNRWSHPQGAPGWWIIAYTPKPSTTEETVPGDEWVMVPREPTEAMLGAASGPSVAVYANEEENQWTALNADEAREVWSAMLTAAGVHHE